MKAIAIAALFVFMSLPAFGAKNHDQGSNIPANSKIFIEPMDGFETYMSAALGKKHVPLLIVTDEAAADFVLSGNAGHQKAGWAKIIFLANVHSDDEASISIVDEKTKTVAFSYAVDKKSTYHGQQTVAEACAKHLKSHMDGKE